MQERSLECLLWIFSGSFHQSQKCSAFSYLCCINVQGILLRMWWLVLRVSLHWSWIVDTGLLIKLMRVMMSWWWGYWGTTRIWSGHCNSSSAPLLVTRDLWTHFTVLSLAACPISHGSSTKSYIFLVTTTIINAQIRMSSPNQDKSTDMRSAENCKVSFLRQSCSIHFKAILENSDQYCVTQGTLCNLMVAKYFSWLQSCDSLMTVCVTKHKQRENILTGYQWEKYFALDQNISPHIIMCWPG